MKLDKSQKNSVKVSRKRAEDGRLAYLATELVFGEHLARQVEGGHGNAGSRLLGFATADGGVGFGVGRRPTHQVWWYLQ